MNIELSYSASQDKVYNDLGYIFLGAAEDYNGTEVHVWLKHTSGAALFNS